MDTTVACVCTFSWSLFYTVVPNILCTCSDAYISTYVSICIALVTSKTYIFFIILTYLLYVRTSTISKSLVHSLVRSGHSGLKYIGYFSYVFAGYTFT